MSTIGCEEYTILVLAGLGPGLLPETLIDAMEEHLKGCQYHNGPDFSLSMIGTPVPNEITEAAEAIVERFTTK